MAGSPAHRVRRGGVVWLAVAVALATLTATAATSSAEAAPGGGARASRTDGALPPGFTDTTVLGGLEFPTAVDLAADGRVFVAEKSGIVKVFDGLGDPTAQTFADLRTQVHDYWDRGLTDLALHPDFPADPRVYVLYSHNAPKGRTAPRWTDPSGAGDDCPTPPGPLADGCVISGRLSVLRAGPGGSATGGEQVLIEDWCQQYPAHSVAGLAFGPDGALYASAGDGAGFTFIDIGQVGDHPNPCGDPPRPAGTALGSPDSEGGALRAQDVRTTGDPTGLNGSLIRIDPDSGAALPDNPSASSADPNTRRIVAHGFRNPFRFGFRPGTAEIWLADVGYDAHEELDRVADPTDAHVENFGWPCYEGPARQPGYEAAALDLCRDLYDDEPHSTTAPWLSYGHDEPVTAADTCAPNGSSITGVAFYPGGPFPDRYDGALFFADYARSCIWVVPAGAGGAPDRDAVTLFTDASLWPVDLDIGADGALYYLELWSGELRRIAYEPDGPVDCAEGAFRAEVFASDDLSGSPVLTRCETEIDHDWGSGGPAPGAGPDGFSVRWTGTPTLPAGTTTFEVHADDGVRMRIDDDVVLDDWGPSEPVTRTAARVLPAGPHRVVLEYRDVDGPAQVALRWSAGDQPPVPTIDAPGSTLAWSVGAEIAFSGRAVDAEDGVLPPSALTWSLDLEHCPDACHTHPVLSLPGVAEGSVVAPDHGYPSHLTLRLTATDSDGRAATVSRRLDPRTVRLHLDSRPQGMALAVGAEVAVAPFTRTVIAGSTVSVSAPSPQEVRRRTYHFVQWADDDSATRILNPTSDRTLSATYSIRRPDPRGRGGVPSR